MGDSLVNLQDVLSAMADSLMEKQPKPFNPQLKFNDKKIKYKIGSKPPREIFYRKTTTFLTALPPAVSKKVCSCRYMCLGDIATIKCHSCSIYDPRGVALFCQPCFHAVHPWYRIAHIYTTIEMEESIEHTLKIAHRIAEAARYEREGNDLLQGLQGEIPKLEEIGNDEKIDDKMRLYGRKMMALEDHITEIRHRLKADLHKAHPKSFVVPPTTNPPPPSSSSSSKSEKEGKLGRGNSVIRRAIENVEPYRHDYDSVLPPPEVEEDVVQTDFSPHMIQDEPIEIVEDVEHPETNVQEQVEAVVEQLLPDRPSTVVPEEPVVEEETMLSEGKQNSVNEISDAKEEKEDPVTILHLQQEMKEDDHGHDDATIVAVEPQAALQVDATTERMVAPHSAESDETKAAKQFDEMERSQQEAQSSKAAPVYTDAHFRAVVNIQRLFKGHVARKVVSSIISLRIVRVFSPDFGRDYYFDRVTGVSSWIAPKLLRPEHHDELEYIHEPTQKVIWTCKNTIAMLKMTHDVSHISHDQKKSVQIIQGFARCILARHKVLSKLNHKFRRVLDTEDSTGSTFYYANIFTGETSWEKLKLYCATEPPILDMEQLNQQDDKKNKKNKNKNKRSPRLNRIS